MIFLIGYESKLSLIIIKNKNAICQIKKLAFSRLKHSIAWVELLFYGQALDHPNLCFNESVLETEVQMIWQLIELEFT